MKHISALLMAILILAVSSPTWGARAMARGCEVGPKTWAKARPLAPLSKTSSPWHIKKSALGPKQRVGHPQRQPPRAAGMPAVIGSN